MSDALASEFAVPNLGFRRVRGGASAEEAHLKSKVDVTVLTRRRPWAPRFIAIGVVGLFSVVTFAVDTQALATDVYVYRDAQGNRVYTDQRPQGPSQVLRLDSASHESTDDQARREAQRAEVEKTITERLARDKAQAAEQAAAKAERDKRCQAAQRENARFAYGGRIYEIDAKGNRVFYSAEEIDRRRAEAARAMAANCAAR